MQKRGKTIHFQSYQNTLFSQYKNEKNKVYVNISRRFWQNTLVISSPKSSFCPRISRVSDFKPTFSSTINLSKRLFNFQHNFLTDKKLIRLCRVLHSVWFL